MISQSLVDIVKHEYLNLELFLPKLFILMPLTKQWGNSNMKKYRCSSDKNSDKNAGPTVAYVWKALVILNKKKAMVKSLMFS